MEDSFETEIHQVVRRYSLAVAEETPSNTLSQGLGATAQRQVAKECQQREDFDSWVQWLRPQGRSSSDPALLRLENHKVRVVEKWKELHSSSSLHDEEILRDIPSIPKLLEAVQTAETTWAKKKESKSGKTKSAVESFLDTMNDYSYLFSIIPNGDKYTSLITGVITSVVKASVNHKTQAEKFSEALEDITKDLETIDKSIRISNSPQMKNSVVGLYVAVFDFLCDAIDWYSNKSRRFRNAFNKNSAADIDKIVGSVKKAVERIRLEADQVTQDRVQDIQQGVSSVQLITTQTERGVVEINQRMKLLREEVLADNTGRQEDREVGRDTNKLLHELRDLVFLALGDNATSSLLATGQATKYQQKVTTKALAIERGEILSDRQISIVGNDLATISEDRLEVCYSYTKDEIQESTAPYLDTFLQDGRSQVLTATSTISRSFLPAEVTQRIGNWIGDPSSKFLWIWGPVYVAAERQLSLAAARIYDSALSARNPVPCVSFTPTSGYIPQQSLNSTLVSAMSKQEEVLISLLYCIAGQLIRLLPDTIDSATEEFDTQVFKSLDGSLTSASVALDLIRSLLAYSPPILIVIIDKLQLAECSSTVPYLERFVEILRNRAPSQIIKVLFITGGISMVLARSMDNVTEKVDAGRMVQAKPGQPLRGWSSLNNFHLPYQPRESGGGL
ncbi:hypothetical protein F5Y00DRAFT_268768 [Daldinia vernicosa]|uniref:uncharacterized protein n=1 Tax=Daldinia vernicosa TaxID=114800 RepID=UPI002008D131|nr:uncharacterized protein F5Y00DRAFT_268768 [Daldinia vernicosa]KAI0850006.1 hypothetical protein F5Y00DRAFT_268768 [Daldinia vernicosa]